MESHASIIQNEEGPDTSDDKLEQTDETKTTNSTTALFFATFSMSLCLLSGIIGLVFVGIGAQAPNGSSLAGFHNVTGTTAQIQKVNFVLALVLFIIAAVFFGISVIALIAWKIKGKKEKEDQEVKAEEEHARKFDENEEAANIDDTVDIPEESFTVANIGDYCSPNLYAATEEKREEEKEEIDDSLFTNTNALGKLFDVENLFDEDNSLFTGAYAVDNFFVEEEDDNLSSHDSLFMETNAFGKVLSW